ncbi:MAG TPA: hypothetical protein VGF29_07155 [Hyphomicrobiaceae bacterium]|jgi:hypothetical protein
MLKITQPADAAVPPEVEVNAYSVDEFCQRNSMCRTVFYRAVRMGDIRLTKFYGRSIVLAEDETAFRRKLKAGKLSPPPPRKPPRRTEAQPQPPEAA